MQSDIPAPTQQNYLEMIICSIAGITEMKEEKKKAFSANDSSLLLPLQATASDKPRSWQVLEAIKFSLLEKEDFLHLSGVHSPS